VLEALCLGTPLIGWDQGGAAEIMTEMFPQAKVDTHDMAALEARTRSFLDHPQTVAQSNAFTLEESMNRHLAVYQELRAIRNPGVR
jgi:glycosyltransferase involved in cell wall biosynthesis